MLIRFNAQLGRHIAIFHQRQQAILILFLVVKTFLIDGKETREDNNLARGPQFMLPGGIALSHRGALQLRS